MVLTSLLSAVASVSNLWLIWYRSDCLKPVYPMASVNFPNQFYIGRRVDPKTGDATEEPQVYDPDDLTTHAVVVGMTGSGKTGLCLDMMEEAALNNLPAILIDPKGDITNLLLHFPELLPEDFHPWINANDARRDGKTTEQAAAETAALWKDGLKQWGIESDRIQQLKDSVDRAVYTPGSTSGKPISILASLNAPDANWDTQQEVLLEQIEGTVTALLGLIGFDNIDPVSDPEHILISKIIADSWAAGKDVDMGELIMQTQNPPFEKLGFFSVDQFFPKKKRTALAMKLNSIVAAPSFQPWISGEPLDIQSLLYTEEGKPKHSIFYIAHLSETERMFIVTLLYSAIETWMRSQSGSGSLRALVYFDEVFGYLPPTANPPSKKPMLRMFKQARAFGVGMVVATQNPVDIDYKGLSNAGTWLVGRLQTERDKERLLDGLQGASGGEFDRSASDKMLSSLGKRQFMINNVHDRNGPSLFQTRWAMNYMAGPMTRKQIAGLNQLAGVSNEATQKTGQSAKTRSGKSTEDVRKLDGHTAAREQATREPVDKQVPQPAAVSATGIDKALKNYTRTRPAFSTSLDEYYLPLQYSFSRALQKGKTPVSVDDAEKIALIYEPALLMQVDVLYTDRKGSYSERRRYAVKIPEPSKRVSVDFSRYTIDTVNPDNLDLEPEDDAYYTAIDEIYSSSRKIKPVSRKYIDHIYREAVLPLHSNTVLKMTSEPSESRQSFYQRCLDEAEEKEEVEIDKIQSRFDKQLDRLHTKIRREQRDLEEDEDTLAALKVETMVSYSRALAGFAGGLFGRRRRSNLSSTLSKRRQKQNAEADVRESLEELDALRSQLEKMTDEHRREMLKIDQKWHDIAAEIELVNVSPLKKNIELELFGVLWQPHWLARVNGKVRSLPAG